MQSSIYADLKKFAGKIEGKKVSAMAELECTNDELVVKPVVKPVVKSAPRVSAKIAVKADEPEITIEAIADMIKAPLVPLRDASGFVHDTATIAAKCDQGHIHKYLIRDVTRSAVKCMTCSTGNKFMIMVRTVIETALGVPFALKESTTSGIEYSNPKLGISIVCSRIPGDNSVVKTGDIIKITIHPTTSIKKVKDTIHDYLINYPELGDSVFEKIKTLKGEKIKAKIFAKEPLPYSQDLAAVQLAYTRADPIIAQMQMNIVDESVKLCLEDC